MMAVEWSTGDTYLGVTVLVLLFLSGFFASAETALVRMNKSRARSLRDEGRRGGKALVQLAEAPEKFLNPLLLLVLICQLVSATMVGVLAERLFGAAGVLVATIAEVVVIFVIFEAIPKNYAVQYPDKSALSVAPIVASILKFWPIKWLSRLLLAIADGAIGLLGESTSSHRMTESEVLAMADVAHEDEAIASEERNFIHSVIEFGDTIVREIMVPRTDIVELSATATVREALDLAITTGRTRIPVTGEDIDDVVGIVNLRHLAGLVAEGRGEEAISVGMGEPRFVPETKKVALLLTEIRQAKTHMCIVIDEHGGTAGLVTLEDILEELVGEITDESDPVEVEEEIQSIEAGIEVSGRENIGDINDEYSLSLPTGAWDTVGGLVLDLAGDVPEVGDSFDTEHYRLTVIRIDGVRIEEVLIEPVQEQE